MRVSGGGHRSIAGGGARDSRRPAGLLRRRVRRAQAGHRRSQRVGRVRGHPLRRRHVLSRRPDRPLDHGGVAHTAPRGRRTPGPGGITLRRCRRRRVVGAARGTHRRTRDHRRLQDGAAALLPRPIGDPRPDGHVPGARLRPGARRSGRLHRHRGQRPRRRRRRAGCAPHHRGLQAGAVPVLPRAFGHPRPDGHLPGPGPGTGRGARGHDRRTARAGRVSRGGRRRHRRPGRLDLGLLPGGAVQAAAGGARLQRVRSGPTRDGAEPRLHRHGPRRHRLLAQQPVPGPLRVAHPRAARRVAGRRPPDCGGRADHLRQCGGLPGHQVLRRHARRVHHGRLEPQRRGPRRVRRRRSPARQRHGRHLRLPRLLDLSRHHREHDRVQRLGQHRTDRRRLRHHGRPGAKQGGRRPADGRIHMDPVGVHHPAPSRRQRLLDGGRGHPRRLQPGQPGGRRGPQPARRRRRRRCRGRRCRPVPLGRRPARRPLQDRLALSRHPGHRQPRLPGGQPGGAGAVRGSQVARHRRVGGERGRGRRRARHRPSRPVDRRQPQPGRRVDRRRGSRRTR